MFDDVPFKLPFAVPSIIDKTNRDSLFRIYNNIYFTYVTSLAKAFIQELGGAHIPSNQIAIKRNDLDAILGVSSADTFFELVKSFLCEPKHYNYRQRLEEHSVQKSRIKYHSFLDVLNDLKTTYEQKIRKKKTRIRVHHYLSYESLFRNIILQMSCPSS